MTTAGDVTFSQDGAKLHPYLVALVRWCVSCFWSTATVLLHRLMTAPLTPITAGPKPQKSRGAGKEHLHPEPKVECAVLYAPEHHKVDVVFVHGLYGSLGNTWRQGEWKEKYPLGPEKIQLKRSNSIPTPNLCEKCSDPNSHNSNSHNDSNSFNNGPNLYNDNHNESNLFNDFTNIDFYEDIKKILPDEDIFTTEKFYNNTLLDQVEIVDNYESQAKFVSDLFKASCDNECDNNKLMSKYNNENLFNDKQEINDKFNDNVSCKCEGSCDIGCGCNCDECYSECWPKDWIKRDYPEARVISINYTSDPHLWRPLWIKENKRLRLHERAEQMTQQLLELGLGEKPIIWVGHSKGGLFIKQMYCEAYEAYKKTNKVCENTQEKSNIVSNNENIFNDRTNINSNNNIMISSQNNETNHNNGNQYNDVNVSFNHYTEINDLDNGNDDNRENAFETNEMSSNKDEDYRTRSRLWSQSAGFMFYSVPHRGSPLADIKTPFTARSVELIEITKNCPLVLDLQDRWLRATETSPPLVRSLVETRRTLMSVLWLTIVSYDSADPGIGALCGVSVDHREICKPSSRHCLLYTELTTLIDAAFKQCKCQ